MPKSCRAVTRRLVRGVLLSAMLFGLSGCYEQNTRVIVYPDGSGRIVMSRFFPATTVRLMDGMQSMQGGMGDGIRMEELFYSEARLKREAKTLFGKGVRFVSARRVDANSGRGSVAVYAFDKVAGLSLAPETLAQNAMSGMYGHGMNDDDIEEEVDEPETPAAENEDEDEDARYRPGGAGYRFTFTAGPQPQLAVKVPKVLRGATDETDDDNLAEQEEMMADQMDDPEGSEQYRKILMAGGNPLKLTGTETMLEIMTRLYKGVKISLDVEVRGAATTVAATYPDPFQSGRCTLMGLDGEAMFGDEAMRKKLPALMDYMGGSQLARLIGKPGVRFETRPEVTFTFAAPAASR